MIRNQKYIFSVLTILAIVISLYACAYTSTVTMNSMGMASNSAENAEHIDHAHSLTLAIIPTLLLLILPYLATILFYESIKLNTLLVLLYTLIDISPPQQKKIELYLYNPRSPPIY